jgi:Co/Zn/Cd efflux system component
VSSAAGLAHRHGRRVHAHAHRGVHRHIFAPQASISLDDVEGVGGDSADCGREPHHHHPDHDHGHTHGLVDRSILRSRAGLNAVFASLLILGVTAGLQAAIFAVSSSVALLADLIHNAGDALTAIPLGIAFFLRSARGEKLAGLAVVLAIFISACVALYETIMRFIHPQHLSHLWVLAAAGLIGFGGNELAAQVRLTSGRRLASAALVADGNHARIDGFVSLGVVASAVVVALGVQIADPIIGLAITLVILKITWDSWNTVWHAEIDLEHIEDDDRHQPPPSTPRAPPLSVSSRRRAALAGRACRRRGRRRS